MIYPEPFENIYPRYLNFYKKVAEKDFTVSKKPKVVIMVSHGNSVQSFMEITDPEARKNDIIGVGYCCLSIARKCPDGKWASEMLGDATHVGCGTSDLIPSFDFD